MDKEKSMRKIFVFILLFLSIFSVLAQSEIPVKIESITASSMYEEQRDVNEYKPSKVFDGDLKTGWFENADGPGINETLTIVFAEPILIDMIKVFPGWFNPKYWNQNHRIKEMKITFNDEKYLITKFKDIMAGQNVKIGGKLPVTKIEFQILDTYPSKNYDDTGITEIHFYNGSTRYVPNLDNFAMDFIVKPKE